MESVRCLTGLRVLVPLFFLFSCATVTRGEPVLAPPTVTGVDAGTVLKPGPCDAGTAGLIGRTIAATGSIQTKTYTKKNGLKDHSGTGIVLDKKGRTLTAYHVVEKAEFISMTFRTLGDDGKIVNDDREMPMKIIAVVRGADMAILAPKYSETIPQPLVVSRTWKAKRGDILWQFGKTTSRACGEVMQPSTFSGTIPVVELKIAADFGDSGGPLMTPDGKLVGFLISINKEAGLAYFVPIADALDALERKLKAKKKRRK